MGLGIKLPEFSRPETSRPEIPILLLPFSGHIVRFGEEPLSGICSNRLRRRLKNRLPLQCRAVDSLTQKSDCLLNSLCFVRNQSIEGWLLAGCQAREDLDACWFRHAFGLFPNSIQTFLAASDRIGRKNQRLMVPVLFLISVGDAAI